MILEEGQVLDGTYRLVRLIGEGGMGRVFEATHARLAGRYAIKVLLHKLSSNSEALRRFDREARITSSLQHPNIVQVIDFNSAPDGTEFLVMEFLPGENLASRLYREGPLPLETVVDIVDQVAAGLAAAHAHGIVHRDLKPDNVFLVPVEGRSTEWAKILDFGISKMGGATAAPGGPVSALLGTPLYMAPEQCQGRTNEVNGATDQFALAAITYEMLTGRSPFAGETVGEVLTHVIHDQPPRMGGDPNVEAVVLRGLSKSNARRFPTVVNFAEALRAAASLRLREVADPGTDAYAVGELAGSRIRRADARRKWSILLPAAAAIALTSAFIAREARNDATEAVVGPPGAPVTLTPARSGTVRQAIRVLPTGPRPALAARPVFPEEHAPADAALPSPATAAQRMDQAAASRSRGDSRSQVSEVVTARRREGSARRDGSSTGSGPGSISVVGNHRVAAKSRSAARARDMDEDSPRPPPAFSLHDDDATLPLDDAIADRPSRP